MTQKQHLAELFEEMSDTKQARTAYEAAAQWYEDDNASALANKLFLKAGDLAALEEDYISATQHSERVAKQAVSNNLLRYSVKDCFLRGGICHLALDIVGTKRALEVYRVLDPQFTRERIQAHRRSCGRCRRR